jgi:hypothetical protein
MAASGLSSLANSGSAAGALRPSIWYWPLSIRRALALCQPLNGSAWGLFWRTPDDPAPRTAQRNGPSSGGRTEAAISSNAFRRMRPVANHQAAPASFVPSRLCCPYSRVLILNPVVSTPPDARSPPTVPPELGPPCPHWTRTEARPVGKSNWPSDALVPAPRPLITGRFPCASTDRRNDCPLPA